MAEAFGERPHWIRMARQASGMAPSGLLSIWSRLEAATNSAVRLREGHEPRGLMRAIGLEYDLAISDRPRAVAVPRSATMLCGVETARG